MGGCRKGSWVAAAQRHLQDTCCARHLLALEAEVREPAGETSRSLQENVARVLGVARSSQNDVLQARAATATGVQQDNC